MLLINKFLISILSICLIAFNVNAQMSSAQPVDSKFTAEQIGDFTKQVEKYLAKNGARVAIISRSGRPESALPKGVSYTHSGIAVYGPIKDEENNIEYGYRIYNLYQILTQLNKSEIVVDFPFDFYAGAMKLKTGIIIPKPNVQKKIYEAINNQAFTRLHNADYSTIANPFNNTYQNCNELIMNVVVEALYNTQDMQEIKAIQRQYFTPYHIPINGLAVWFGSIFSKEIQSMDHNSANYTTTTFNSMSAFFTQYNLAHKVAHIEY